MKKLLFAVLIGTLLVAGCTQSGGNPPVTAGNDSVPVGSDHAVKIAGFAFDPKEITIKKGDTITWMNDDAAPHDVASDPHPTHTDLPGLRSGTLQSGQSYTFQFVKVGTWGYHCHLHPTMKGTVIVE